MIIQSDICRSFQTGSSDGFKMEKTPAITGLPVAALWFLLSLSCEAGPLPDKVFTPGAVNRSATKAVVCSTRWGKNRRHVTAGMRRQVFSAYGMTGAKDAACQPKGCELDHLISRELGGADDVANLWPQPYSGPWNAKMKDRLENRLHREVCHGGMRLEDAQRAISRDWPAAYVRYFGRP